MNTPDSSGWSQRTQRGIAASASAGFETRNATQAGSIVSSSARASRSATAPGARRRPRMRPPELALDDQLREVLVGQALAGRPAGIRRRREGRQHVVVEEVRERAVPDVVEQPGHPQRLDDQALGRDGLAGRRERRAQARVERARPQAGLVHDPEPVREARVLRGREDPPGALELADPAQALEPGRVEQVLLGHLLVRQSGRTGLVRREALGQLDVAVDRVADEVDGSERVARHQS